MIAIVCVTNVRCRPADERTPSITGILEALNLLSPVVNSSLPDHLGTEYTPSYQPANNPYMQNRPYDEKPYTAPANRPYPADGRPAYVEKPYNAPSNRPYDEKPYTAPANRPYPVDGRPPYIEKPYTAPANRPYPADGRPPYVEKPYNVPANRPYDEKPYMAPANRPYSPYVKLPQAMPYNAKPMASYLESYSNPSYYSTTTRRPLPPIKLVLSLPGIPALEKAPKPKPIPLCPPGQIAKPNILSPNVKLGPAKRQVNFTSSYAEKEEIKDYICTIIPIYSTNNYDQTYLNAPVYNYPSKTPSYVTAAPSYQSTVLSTVPYPMPASDAAPYDQSYVVAPPSPSAYSIPSPAVVASQPAVPISTAYSSFVDQPSIPSKALNRV